MAYSFEFFPPKTAQGAERLRAERAALAALEPAFFSVTFGAGGSTRDGTLETVREIQREGRVPAAPHISCIGADEQSLRALLDAYHDLGIRRLVTLRGDANAEAPLGARFRHASDLVAFIRETTGDRFHIEVAGYPEFHPESGGAKADLEALARKVAAGADSVITQYFFNADAYFRYRDSLAARGIDVPVVPGVMPITNFVQLARFSDKCGAEIPRWIRWRLADFGDDLDSLRAFGFEVTLELCRRLLDGGAPGLHLYALNRSQPAIDLWQALGLAPAR